LQPLAFAQFAQELRPVRRRLELHPMRFVAKLAALDAQAPHFVINDGRLFVCRHDADFFIPSGRVVRDVQGHAFERAVGAVLENHLPILSKCFQRVRAAPVFKV